MRRVGGGGGGNDPKIDYVICERLLSISTFYILYYVSYEKTRTHINMVSIQNETA